MLKISAVTLYKHGLGYFQRSGEMAHSTVELSVPRTAMDDVLKSLTVLPTGGASVRSVAFETPDDRNETVRREPIGLSLVELVSAFMGAAVRVEVGGREVAGRLGALEIEGEKHLKRALLIVATSDGIVPLPLSAITKVTLDDARARSELDFALLRRRRDEASALLRIDLSEPAAVEVSYIAPAPSWRASYRVLIEPAKAGGVNARDVFVQGWALFDNTLDEDLDDVQLTLTAGMPVSFRYGLHQPNTPERPLVEDEDRTVGAPLEYELLGAAGGDNMMMAPSPARVMKHARNVSRDAVAASTQAAASVHARDALFAYVIDAPISVRRGESGMVPIVILREKGRRELIYNRDKHPHHPAATVRVKTPEGLTLERGPALIVDRGSYGGEAIVPFTVGGTELILGYAIELGVTVTRTYSTREVTAKVAFSDRSVFVQTRYDTTTNFEVNSMLAEPVELVIEHVREHGSTLQTKAEEEAMGIARFRVAVPARGRAHLEVVEQTVRRTEQDVTGLTGHAVRAFLQGRLLTDAMATTLDAILKREAEIEDLGRIQTSLDAERKTARARIEETLKILSAFDVARDGTLRDRFVAKLDAQDMALQALDQREQQLLMRIAALNVEIADATRSLAEVQPA